MKNKNEILNELKSLSQKDYKTFNDKIIQTKQTTIGARVPALRGIAKRISKDDYMSFIALDKQDNYEMIMLEGMVLSYVKKPFLELLPLTQNYLKKVDNWACVDSVICGFKSIKKDKDEVLHVVKNWLKSDKEFVVRAGLVVLLNYYIQEENLAMIFELSQSVEHRGYYVFMANSWLISVCMAKFPQRTIEFFKNNRLDSKTHNKAIQKSRESYRVSKDNKELILGYNK